MNFINTIEKKRDKERLSKEEIRDFINRYVAGEIPDYQVSALLMAIYLNGCDDEETYELTMAMAESGDIMDLSGIPGIKVDKHSTGGVGDKVTLIAAPVAAACGVPTAKMSGRGLGFTGGTIDKLESIPGFSVSLEEDEFISQVKKTGYALIGQTKDLTPADKLLYALRDVTGTVGCIPLIASSIMSKKIAAGSDAIVLEVTHGTGAFMKDERSACELARIMIDIGRRAGLYMRAVITDMNEPLGHAIGNSLEVIEAIEALKGNAVPDVLEVMEVIIPEMIMAGGKAGSKEEAWKLAVDQVSSGRALEVFKKMIEAQHGNPCVADDYSLFPQAAVKTEVYAERNGYLSVKDCAGIGECVKVLGGGRITKEQMIDLSVGLDMKVKNGERVSKGDCLCEIYSRNNNEAEAARKQYLNSVEITDEEPVKNRLIYTLDD
ncbi:MAG: thymidine phosphorylase [Lachnospiraceae bacterium]|nr:thymidine phosphorylase [Lachnospiraceae bacterium]